MSKQSHQHYIRYIEQQSAINESFDRINKALRIVRYECQKCDQCKKDCYNPKCGLQRLHSIIATEKDTVQKIINKQGDTP
jgi:signal recognition particle subunit SEC65